MKLGIIGYGMIVKEFLPYLQKLDGVEIISILGKESSLSKVKELCDEYQIPLATSNFVEFCSSGIDTVYVAVPNFLHFDYCKKVLEQGLHVIVEKPITSNDKEANILANLAKNKKLFLFEAITTLYLGNYLKIKEWLPRIGTIKLVQSQFNQYSSRYDSFLEGKLAPVFDRTKSGGALMDLNLYNLHYVMGLFGEPLDVMYYANIEKDIDTSGIIVLKYPNFIASCIAAKDSKGICGGIIQGTKGCIRTVNTPNSVGKAILELNDGTIEEYDDGMETTRMIPEFITFIQAINEQNFDFCYQQLEKSLAVSRIQTTARKKAGIIFPVD